MGRLLLVLFCCAACTTESPELAARNATPTHPDAETGVMPPDPNDAIALSRFSIEGVAIRMGEAEVRHALGTPPTAFDPEESPGHSYVRWGYPGVWITFDRHQVLNVECLAPSACTTSDGVRIGASHEAVERAYGTGYRGYALDNVLIYYAIGRRDCALYFNFLNDVVFRITYSCDMPVPRSDRRPGS